jgi:hypothetical protein
MSWVEFVRNMVHVVLYGADKAVIVYIVHSELYRIIILNNNYDYYSIDITASALYSWQSWVVDTTQLNSTILRSYLYSTLLYLNK